MKARIIIEEFRFKNEKKKKVKEKKRKQKTSRIKKEINNGYLKTKKEKHSFSSKK